MENKNNSYLITERPVEMSYETYKLLKNYQKKSLKEYKRGQSIKIKK